MAALDFRIIAGEAVDRLVTVLDGNGVALVLDGSSAVAAQVRPYPTSPVLLATWTTTVVGGKVRMQATGEQTAAWALLPAWPAAPHTDLRVTPSGGGAAFVATGRVYLSPSTTR